MTIQSFSPSLPHSASTPSPIHMVDLPHTLFERWVDQFPESIAIVTENETLTFLEVEQRSNRIAHALRSAHAQAGDMVAVLLERGPDLVCALMGVLKSGAAFVALDPKTPRDALARTLSGVNCRLVLSRREYACGLPATSSQVLLLDGQAPFACQPVTRPASRVDANDPACVLFTSGSTGQPKAVLYLHRNLTARFSNTICVSGFDQYSKFAQTSPVTSIDALDEILVPLVSGGCTAVLPYSTVTHPHQLIDSLSRLVVTHILLVPSLLRVILSAESDLDRKLAALRVWMVGGEPLTATLTHEFYRQLPEAVLINFYGLTEGDATFHVTSPSFPYDTSVPVGRPVSNTNVYLLDDCLDPVPSGKPGEICLAGEGLFHQYMNCPELNSQRWVLNPFAADGFYARLFRTGDMGRLNADGEIEYLGRSDRMVKVRGFRVELGEVESALARHPAVDQCIVIARQPAGSHGGERNQQTYLVAFAVPKSGGSTSSHTLREFLKDQLPGSAIPSTVTLLDSLPLSANGKVDIHALSQREPLRARESYIAPRNTVERQLTQIWEKILDFSPIGVEDRFFDVGGDSLAAIDLMLTIEKEFKCRLPITALIQWPTITALAQFLQGAGKLPCGGSLVPIRSQGSRPPLFCIHADGSVFIYRRFAEYLNPEVPIYGLQAHGLANPKDQPYHHIEEMAAHYICEIRTVQPQGPYHLCAFSAGGLIIFEMARQLQELEEEVAFLGLLDAYGPDYPQYLPDKNQVGYKLSVHLNTLRLHSIRGQLRYLSGRVRHRTRLLLYQSLSKVLLKLHMPLPGKVRYEYIAKLIDRAAQIYPEGRFYSGDAVLFHACTQPAGIIPDRTLGWGEMVTGHLEVEEVVGTHNSIMTYEPHVSDLVRKIGDRLARLHLAASESGALTRKNLTVMSLN